MNKNQRIRQIHRWVSMAFTVIAFANVGALIAQADAQWLGLLALPPLLVMMPTGVYLFVQPILARRGAA